MCVLITVGSLVTMFCFDEAAPLLLSGPGVTIELSDGVRVMPWSFFFDWANLANRNEPKIPL